jgi:hypothetical protein
MSSGQLRIRSSSPTASHGHQAMIMIELGLFYPSLRRPGTAGFARARDRFTMFGEVGPHARRKAPPGPRSNYSAVDWPAC